MHTETRDGRLYITGTRILVRNVYDVHNSGVTLKRLAEQWNVEREKLDSAIKKYEENKEEVEERRSREKKGNLFDSPDSTTTYESAD